MPRAWIQLFLGLALLAFLVVADPKRTLVGKYRLQSLLKRSSPAHKFLQLPVSGSSSVSVTLNPATNLLSPELKIVVDDKLQDPIRPDLFWKGSVIDGQGNVGYALFKFGDGDIRGKFSASKDGKSTDYEVLSDKSDMLQIWRLDLQSDRPKTPGPANPNVPTLLKRNEKTVIPFFKHLGNFTIRRPEQSKQPHSLFRRNLDPKQCSSALIIDQTFVRKFKTVENILTEVLSVWSQTDTIFRNELDLSFPVTYIYIHNSTTKTLLGSTPSFSSVDWWYEFAWKSVSNPFPELSGSPCIFQLFTHQTFAENVDSPGFNLSSLGWFASACRLPTPDARNNVGVNSWDEGLTTNSLARTLSLARILAGSLGALIDCRLIQTNFLSPPTSYAQCCTSHLLETNYFYDNLFGQFIYGTVTNNFASPNLFKISTCGKREMGFYLGLPDFQVSLTSTPRVAMNPAADNAQCASLVIRNPIVTPTSTPTLASTSTPSSASTSTPTSASTSTPTSASTSAPTSALTSAPTSTQIASSTLNPTSTKSDQPQPTSTIGVTATPTPVLPITRACQSVPQGLISLDKRCILTCATDADNSPCFVFAKIDNATVSQIPAPLISTFQSQFDYVKRSDGAVCGVGFGAEDWACLQGQCAYRGTTSPRVYNDPPVLGSAVSAATFTLLPTPSSSVSSATAATPTRNVLVPITDKTDCGVCAVNELCSISRFGEASCIKLTQGSCQSICGYTKMNVTLWGCSCLDSCTSNTKCCKDYLPVCKGTPAPTAGQTESTGAVIAAGTIVGGAVGVMLVSFAILYSKYHRHISSFMKEMLRRIRNFFHLSRPHLNGAEAQPFDFYNIARNNQQTEADDFTRDQGNFSGFSLELVQTAVRRPEEGFTRLQIPSTADQQYTYPSC